MSKSILLKDVPEEAIKIILAVQGQIKSEKVGQFSQQQTILKIITEYPKLVELAGHTKRKS